MEKNAKNKKLTVKELVKRVEKGIKWLNKHKKGWYKDIDLNILDLSQEDVCVVGQLYESFWKGKISTLRYISYDFKTLSNGMTTKEGEKCGFFLEDAYARVDGQTGYDTLTRIWWLEIVELRSK